MYYLISYEKKKETGKNESYYLLTDELIEGLSKLIPFVQISCKNGIVENYKLIAILHLCPNETIEDLLLYLTNKLNSPIKYKNKFYGEYQSKLGREISAHKIDVLSNRRSSRRSVPTDIRNNPEDKRDNAIAKVVHHNLKDDLFASIQLDSYEQFLEQLNKKEFRFVLLLHKLYEEEFTKNYSKFHDVRPLDEIKFISIINIINNNIREEYFYWLTWNKLENSIAPDGVRMPRNKDTENMCDCNFKYPRPQPYEHFISSTSSSKMSKLIDAIKSII